MVAAGPAAGRSWACGGGIMTRIIDGVDVDELAARTRGKEYTPPPAAEVDRLLADPEISALPSLAGHRPVPKPPRHPVRYRTPSFAEELERAAPVRAALPGEVL